MIEKSMVDGLVGSPSESLNVEIKRWIDPTQIASIEKIAKGVLALRNRNGGFSQAGTTGYHTLERSRARAGQRSGSMRQRQSCRRP
jgi:hypothetical protein